MEAQVSDSAPPSAPEPQAARERAPLSVPSRGSCALLGPMAPCPRTLALQHPCLPHQREMSKSYVLHRKQSTPPHKGDTGKDRVTHRRGSRSDRWTDKFSHRSQRVGTTSPPPLRARHSGLAYCVALTRRRLFGTGQVRLLSPPPPAPGPGAQQACGGHAD